MAYKKEIEKGISLGVISGVVWGWISYVVNFLSGVFPFEHSIVYNIIVFSIAGAIFGAVVGGFMSVTQDRLPFKNPFTKAVFLSTSLWFVLRVGGLLFTITLPARYHPSLTETVQGFVLAVVLGSILGSLWSRSERRGKSGGGNRASFAG